MGDTGYDICHQYAVAVSEIDAALENDPSFCGEKCVACGGATDLCVAALIKVTRDQAESLSRVEEELRKGSKVTNELRQCFETIVEKYQSEGLPEPKPGESMLQNICLTLEGWNRAEAAERKVATLVKFTKDREWSLQGHCPEPECHQTKKDGHADRCPRKALMEAGGQDLAKPPKEG